MTLYIKIMWKDDIKRDKEHKYIQLFWVYKQMLISR